MEKFAWYYNRIKSYVGRPRLVIQDKPIVLDTADRCDSPIFLIGVHRSGTSLVRRMFNSHPDIACPPESFFMKTYVEMLDDELTEAGYSGFGYDKEEMRQMLARQASDLHEAYRISQGKSIWADKTPRYVFQIDGLDRLFAHKARFVLILRHPGDVVASNFTRGWTFTENDDPFESAVEHVQQGNQAMLAFESAHPDRCARIHYEAMCDDPETVLTQAMTQIGLEYDPEMLRFGEKSHNYGLEDPVVRGKTTIEASSGYWKSLTPEQQGRLVDVFGPELHSDWYWNEPSKQPRGVADSIAPAAE